MGKVMWAAAGVVGGFVLAAAVGVVVVNLLIPWEDICAVVPPLQTTLTVGGDLLAALSAWLEQAQAWLALRPGDAPAEAREGVGGLLDAAQGIAGSAATVALDVVSAPLRVVVAVAAQVLDAVQTAVDAARGALESIDMARCE